MYRQLHLAEPVAGARVCVLTQAGSWQHGVITSARNTVKILENGRLKTLRSVVQIQRDGRAISDKGDSGTLVISADPTLPPHAADAVEGTIIR